MQETSNPLLKPLLRRPLPIIKHRPRESTMNIKQQSYLYQKGYKQGYLDGLLAGKEKGIDTTLNALHTFFRNLIKKY